MNFVFISPYFPVNYYRFCIGLKEARANVLAIGDMPYENLRDELKWVLKEYYRVDDLHNRDQLQAACNHFTHRYGKIDRIESHNEYWLETDAWLRTMYNVPGLTLDEIGIMKSKIRMKEVFSSAGIAVARGQLVGSWDETLQFISQVGYPVIVKPDTGVGASNTYRINNEEDLVKFFAHRSHHPYIMEEFIEGQIHTFDGLVDDKGNIVFYTSHVYNDGIMECVLDQLDVTFYSVRNVPADLEDAGRRSVAAFGIKERFFHLEFFRLPGEGKIVALEANMRPPGGPIIDMMNFANDINIYQEWANMIVHGKFNTAIYDQNLRKYFCAFVGRRNSRQYKLSHEEVLDRCGRFIAAHESLPAVYSQAMGDYFYLIRSPEYDEIAEARKLILA